MGATVRRKSSRSRAGKAAQNLEFEAERRLSLPPIEEIRDAQRRLDQAAPLLVDREARRHGVIGGLPAWAPVDAVARQLGAYERTLLREESRELAELPAATRRDALKTLARAVPAGWHERFEENVAEDIHVARRKMDTTRATNRANARQPRRTAEKEMHRNLARVKWEGGDDARTTEMSVYIARESCAKRGKVCKPSTIEEHIRDLNPRRTVTP